MLLVEVTRWASKKAGMAEWLVKALTAIYEGSSFIEEEETVVLLE